MAKTHREWAGLFADLVKKHFLNKLVSTVLYGSVASGHATQNSDIDLIIVLEGVTAGRFRRRSLFDPLYQEWEKITDGIDVPFISTIIKTPEEAKRLSPLYFDMVDRREFLFDKNDFFRKILDDVKRRLGHLGAKRKKIGKIEYWDLKPDYKPGEIFKI